MKKIYCDICGKEIKSHEPKVDFWKEDIFYNLDDNPIEDVCNECFGMIYCCINMMKETKWKPDFHEVLKSDNIWKRDAAGYKLCDLEDRTGLKF